MTLLHHLAQAAAVILLVELLVVLIIFLAVAGGLAFGLHWVRSKTDWAFGKANGYLALVPKYTHAGTGLVAKPFIVGGGGITRALVILESIRRQAKQIRMTQETTSSPIVAARPVEPEITTVMPAVSEPTTAVPRVPEATSRS